MTERRINAGILGTGHYLPPRILTNEELAQRVDTSDEWITSRTGIHARRIAAADVPVTALAEPAARMALADAGIEAAAIDLIIFATLTPDRVIPAAACELQRRLGAVHAAAFDLSAACSGFVYAAAVACQFIEAGIYRHVLVVGAEELSKVVDWQDRGTCILFGDGAGAAVFTAGDKLKAIKLNAEPAVDKINEYRCLMPTPYIRKQEADTPLLMKGREVFKFAVNTSVRDIRALVARSGLTLDDINYFMIHQANLRIVDAIRENLGIDEARCPTHIGNHGNTSSASYPILLDECHRQGLFRPGDILVFSAFGAGLLSAAAVLEW